MKVIKQEGDIFTVQMNKGELDSLIIHLIDVDREKPALEGEELGDLADHISHQIAEISRLMD